MKGGELMGEVTVKSAEYVGPLFCVNRASILGHDGAYSIPLDDGRVLWAFGDTLIGKERKDYDPEKRLIDEWLNSEWAKDNIVMIANSACFVGTRNATELVKTVPFYIGQTKGRAEEIIPSALAPNRAGRYRPVWPMDGICLENAVYVFCIMMDCGPADPTKGNAPDINVFGAGVAKSEYPFVEFHRLKPTVYPNLPKDPANHPEYQYLWWNCDLDNSGDQTAAYGTGVLKRVLDGYVYIFGSKMCRRNGKVVHGVSLARVRVENIEDVTKYSYLARLDGNNPIWTSDPKAAMLVFDGNANEMSISYNEYLGKFIVFYPYIGDIKPHGIDRFLEEIHMRYADNIWGPWSEPVVVYKCNKSRPDDTCYAAKEHPEYSEKGGKITYLTYVSHQRYWPDLIRIEFS